MPANLTPEYKKAEELYRQATSVDEKISGLELMLKTIPKHKGTDHMQADIKRRISKLRTEPQSKGASRQGDIFHVPKGAVGGQAVLLGTPNSGKSAIVGALTNAHVQVADFPFSTTLPIPGVMMHEDVPIQLVDMPPITRDHVAPGQTNAYRMCDLILSVVDLSAADVTDQV
ncbi:MAG: GTP-binding protein HSR1, partial [Planctomycetes bacterium]|nr:GTP-binding protein HSR1 [Planctomycetota bacterium]